MVNGTGSCKIIYNAANSFQIFIVFSKHKLARTE